MNKPTSTKSQSYPKVKTCSCCGVTGLDGETIRHWSTLCKPCWNARQQERRKAHPERETAHRRKTYQKHSEKRKAERRAYYRKNKEALKEKRKLTKERDYARAKEWRLRNIEHVRAKGRIHDAKRVAQRAIDRRRWVANNREKEKEFTTRWLKSDVGRASRRNTAIKRRIAIKAHRTATTKQVAALFKDARVCPYCQDIFSDTLRKSLDHIMPVSKGGKHTIENLLICCLTCNRKKKAKTPEQWEAYQQKSRHPQNG